MLCDHNLAFTFKVTFGDFCFELDTREIKASPASGPVKTKKKSPSSVERDRRRRMDFLIKEKCRLVSVFRCLFVCAGHLLGDLLRSG